jgi:hypothetical protein
MLSLSTGAILLDIGSSLPDFAQFCRDAHWFDRVVTSLEWG